MKRDYITIWPPFPMATQPSPIPPLTMHPPIKDQKNFLDDKHRDEPGLDASDGAPIVEHDGTISENTDQARQEFKDEADINYMLSRFGVTQPRNSPTFGSWDDSIDLQQAIESTREARDGYNTLPLQLREKFTTMEDFLRAVDNGSLRIRTQEEKPPTAPPPAESAAPGNQPPG